MSQAHLGVDIGSRAVHLVLWDGKNIKKSVAEPLPEGLVKEGRIVSSAAMTEFFKDLRKQYHLPSGYVCLVLHSNECFCRRFDVPAMTHSQLKVNLSYEFRDFITQEKEKYFYDYAVLDRLEDGAKLDLMAAAVAKETIAAYDLMLRKAGFRLRVAIPEEMAYTNLFSRFQPQAVQGSVCLLDLGHAAVALHMLKDGRHQSGRNMDFGCSALDDVIAERFNVAPYVACTYRESNFEGCQDLPACQDIYGRMALEVLKAVNYYNYSNAEQPVEQIYCWGGGMKIEPLLASLRETLSVPVEGWEKLFTALDREPSSLLALGAAVQRG